MILFQNPSCLCVRKKENLLTYSDRKGKLDGMNTTFTENPTVSFTVKGQVVIPVRFRRLFGIRADTKAVVEATPAGILLRPVTGVTIDAGCGMLARDSKKPATYRREERGLEERRAAHRS